MMGSHLKIILVTLGIVGCASVAHRPYACQTGMNQAYAYSPFYFLAGATTQQGDCAIIEPLKIEYGQYYQQEHKAILADLKKGREINRNFGAVHSFSKVFNCSDQASPLFVDTIVRYQDEIFGKDKDNGSRTVTMNVQYKIKNDEFLREECPF
ncbi:hypothetical protein [Bdellovibrio sp. HCB-162]|uniref:hypothetical protein n=1 Tax=Bdellovibrio sp. HCB-162 TaxID=3394234 RepID=UPI0039BC55EF